MPVPPGGSIAPTGALAASAGFNSFKQPRRAFRRRESWSCLPEPGAGRSDLAGPATRRVDRNASDRTRSTPGVDRAAQTARKLSRTTRRYAAGCAPHRGRRVVATGLSCAEVGLHQCPSGKTGPTASGRTFSRPEAGPDRRHSRDFGRQRPRDPAETDSLAEGAGFETSIPLAKYVGLFAERCSHKRSTGVDSNRRTILRGGSKVRILPLRQNVRNINRLLTRRKCYPQTSPQE